MEKNVQHPPLASPDMCVHMNTYMHIHHQNKKETKKMHKGLRKIYPSVFHLKMVNVNMLAYIFLGFKKVIFYEKTPLTCRNHAIM